MPSDLTDLFKKIGNEARSTLGAKFGANLASGLFILLFC